MGYHAAEWGNFAVAVAGAAAALSGLLFVAVSINIQRILTYPHLPGRAGQTLIMLVSPLLVSVLLLVPGQPRWVLGVELIGLGAIAAAVFTRLNRPGTRSAEETAVGWTAARFVPSVLIAGPLLAAGVTLLTPAGGGLYWLVPSVLVAFVAGLGNAWVLLVEILR